MYAVNIMQHIDTKTYLSLKTRRKSFPTFSLKRFDSVVKNSVLNGN